MAKYLSAFFGILLVVVLINQAQGRQVDKPATTDRNLKVNVHYTGSSPVDEKHKIFVFVFNSTEFMQGDGQPIATLTATSKDGTVEFAGLTDSPVYVAVVIDPSGNYDGQSQPPSGSSTAIYAKDPAVPEPIALETGKTTEITLSFDDTHKMR